ncbi:MAG TPA: aromatic-ring-hydroxylating dioxygenase subunit beta [Steroidobacteraceae bacterium]|jgi:3-phenylpropionate/cinnamic acid dioxygenase small subunit|nr:aromatic-ring-hydroxylating dioxygenase subunit beta [Steroidobacteraceae bacterium]
MEAKAITPIIPEAAPAPKSERLPVGSALYNQIVEFLYEEAALLDQIRLQEWGARLAPDLIYTAPLRETRPMDQQNSSFVRTVQHFHDDWRSVMGRIMRLTGTKSAWAEDPPSRTRRLVTNVMAAKTAKADEFSVTSYLLVTRSRFNSPEYDLISAERRDILRQDGDSFKLARREIIVDQAVIGTPNFAIFL